MFQNSKEDFIRKANQAWEMAALARQDGDRADEIQQINKAREFERQIREMEG
jgi:hypothetical protein